LIFIVDAELARVKSAAFNQIVYSSYAYNQKTLRTLRVASASCTPTGKAELGLNIYCRRRACSREKRSF
ncbi:hypothetical protein WNY97_08010, partial [Pseudoalteromonas fuliginea]|uniref:hypothetical protein n=1 Tax=Pseudoalteromonas fuliginea TaxID=1872678 RepID=UPI00316B8FF6